MKGFHTTRPCCVCSGGCSVFGYLHVPKKAVKHKLRLTLRLILGESFFPSLRVNINVKMIPRINDYQYHFDVCVKGVMLY